MTFTVDLCSDLADEIVAKSLKEQYKTVLADIETVKSTKKAQGIYSYDYEEELEALEKAKKHFAFVVEYFTGPDWDN